MYKSAMKTQFNLGLFGMLMFCMTKPISVFAQSTELGDADLMTTIGNLINVILGFVGILAVIGIIFGVPIGVILVIFSYTREDAKKVSASKN